MFSRRMLAVALTVLAVSHMAAAGFLHKELQMPKAASPSPSPSPARAVSGPTVSGAPAVSGAPTVSGAPAPVPPPAPMAGSIQAPVTKEYVVKKALGLAGSTVAASVPPGCKSIYEVVKGDSSLTFLAAALQATGLDSVLSDPALVATVFAPTDAAFTALLTALNLTPQALFNDVTTLTVLLKYHVIPGLTLTKADLVEGQFYDTLLTDSKKNHYQVQYKYIKETSLEALKTNFDIAAASTYVYTVVPSGGKAAKISTFDVNAGCPTVAHVIAGVLVPKYNDALAVAGADNLLNIFNAYQAANATLPKSSSYP